MDDKHIVAQARRGELSAFEELVTRYEKRVYAIALRSSGSPEDAADITQEVFLRAWRSMNYPPAGRKPAAGDRLHQRRRRGSLAAGVRGKGRSAGTARAAGAHGVRGAGSVRGIWRAKKIKTQGHDTQMSCPCVYNQCKGGEPP